MSRFSDQPQSLSDLLNTMAKRVRKVDLRVIDEIRALWPTLVEPAVAELCRPEFVKNGVLVVAVPSGAFAQRISMDAPTIIAGLASLGERAPLSLRTIVGMKP